MLSCREVLSYETLGKPRRQWIETLLGDRIKLALICLFIHLVIQLTFRSVFCTPSPILDWNLAQHILEIRLYIISEVSCNPNLIVPSQRKKQKTLPNDPWNGSSPP